MPEVIYSAFVQTVVSGVAVFLITAYFKKHNDDSIRAAEAEKKLVQKELADMSIKFVSMEQKQDKLETIMTSVKEKVIVVSQKQDDSQVRMFELINTVEGIKKDINYGKVIRK